MTINPTLIGLGVGAVFAICEVFYLMYFYRRNNRMLHGNHSNSNREPQCSSTTCTICLQLIESCQNTVEIQPCTHKFHKNCLDDYRKKEKGCPNCD